MSIIISDIMRLSVMEGGVDSFSHHIYLKPMRFGRSAKYVGKSTNAHPQDTLIFGVPCANSIFVNL